MRVDERLIAGSHQLDRREDQTLESDISDSAVDSLSPASSWQARVSNLCRELRTSVSSESIKSPKRFPYFLVKIKEKKNLLMSSTQAVSSSPVKLAAVISEMILRTKRNDSLL